jgi:hypothetical protein
MADAMDINGRRMESAVLTLAENLRKTLGGHTS